MAATLAQDSTLANDATFKIRVTAAMVRRLMVLLATPASLTSDQLALGRQMIYDPDTYGGIVAKGVVTEAAIIARDGVQGSVTDAEVTAAVNAVLVRYVR